MRNLKPVILSLALSLLLIVSLIAGTNQKSLINDQTNAIKKIGSSQDKSNHVKPVKVNFNSKFSSKKATFFEDFNSGIPDTWTLIDADGLVPAAAVSYITEAWIAIDDFGNPGVGDSVAVSNSWYSPPGQADDWLITPQISLGADDFLQWMAKAQDPSFPDGYEVRISTTTPTIDGFMAHNPLFSIAAEVNAWTERTISLAEAGYSDIPVYFAFRNNSMDMFLLLLNDVEVFEATEDADMSVSEVPYPSEFASIPLFDMPELTLGATVENVGFVPATNVYVELTIIKDEMILNTVNSEIATEVAVGALDTFAFESYTPTEVGVYVFQYVSFIDEEDANALNDTVVTTISITENMLARDKGNVTGALGIGGGNTGELGQTIQINNNVTIDSIKIYLANGENVMTGQPVSAVIRQFSAEPGDILATTDTVIVPDEGAQWINLPIYNGSYNLEAGTYFVGVIEGDVNVTLAYSDEIVTLGTTWVNFPGNPFGGWANSEDYGFPVTYIIRTYLSEEVTEVNDNSNSINQFGLDQNYPNPFNPSTTIPFTLQQGERVILEIFNITGQKILTLADQYFSAGHHEVKLNSANLTSGIYLYKLKAGNKISQKKMLLIK